MPAIPLKRARKKWFSLHTNKCGTLAYAVEAEPAHRGPNAHGAGFFIAVRAYGGAGAGVHVDTWPFEYLHYCFTLEYCFI